MTEKMVKIIGKIDDCNYLARTAAEKMCVDGSRAIVFVLEKQNEIVGELYDLLKDGENGD